MIYCLSGVFYELYYKLYFLLLKQKMTFPCLHIHIITREELGEIETVMQTRDVEEGLHNC